MWQSTIYLFSTYSTTVLASHFPFFSPSFTNAAPALDYRPSAKSNKQNATQTGHGQRRTNKRIMPWSSSSLPIPPLIIGLSRKGRMRRKETREGCRVGRLPSSIHPPHTGGGRSNRTALREGGKEGRKEGRKERRKRGRAQGREGSRKACSCPQNRGGNASIVESSLTYYARQCFYFIRLTCAT